MDKNKHSSQYVLTEAERETIKNWILTGCLEKNFNQNKKFPDELPNKKLLLKNVSFTKSCLEKNIKNKLNKQTQIQTLVCLTFGNFKTKKLFKKMFPLVINSLDDLYNFLETTKSQRGFGQSIKSAINNWIKSMSYNELQKQIILYPNGSGWKFADVLNLIEPQPRSIMEKQIFNYCYGSNNYKNLKVINSYEEIKQNINVEKNIQLLKLSNKNFPCIVKKTENIWEKLFENMDAKEILKNINYLEGAIIKNISLFKNKLYDSDLSPFYIVSNLNKIQNEYIKEITKEIICEKTLNKNNKKVLVLLDTDLEFSTTNSINSMVFPLLYSLNKNYTIKKFYKNKFIEPEITNPFSFLNLKETFSKGSSYSSIFLKTLLKEAEDYEYIIVWQNGKNVIVRNNQLLKNKKVIIVSSNKNVKINRYQKNVYLLQGVSYKTPCVLDLILEGKL